MNDIVDNPRPQHFRIDLDEIFSRIIKEREEKMKKIKNIKELE